MPYIVESKRKMGLRKKLWVIEKFSEWLKNNSER